MLDNTACVVYKVAINPLLHKTYAPKKERANFDYAQKYCLWHYHIGIPEYVGEYDDMTSEYILHYQRFDDEIILVDISMYPPFELPSQDKLKQF